MTGFRASYAWRRRRTSAALWIALAPRHERAECARSPRDGDVHAQGALAAGLDDGVARLHQDREVALDEVGALLGDDSETVEDVVDLLGLVEDEGDVAVGFGDLLGQPEGDSDATLHVAGAEAVQQGAVVAHREVAVEGDGVDVTRDHHALFASEVGAGDQRVADAGHLEMVDAGESLFDDVGQLLLVAAHGLDVHHGFGQSDHVGGEVERHAGHLVTAAVRRGRGPRHPVMRRREDRGRPRTRRCRGRSSWWGGRTRAGPWRCTSRRPPPRSRSPRHRPRGVPDRGPSG